MTKTRIINIVIIVIALALIIFLVTKKKADTTPIDETPVNETPTETNNGATGNQNVIPVPAESSWQNKEVKGKISFDAPSDYYISYPVIGGCKDVVSISTQTAVDPTIAIALIYKEGCVNDADVTGFYAHREVKDGYVFQTNSTNATIRAVFDRIVASAEVK